MQIEITSTSLTKSKILQMNNINIPNPNVEVLGWVNIDETRYVIVKLKNNYYKAKFIINVYKNKRPTLCGYFEQNYHNVTKVIIETFGGGLISFDVNFDENSNMLLYNHCKDYKAQTELMGQIFYD